MAYQLTGDYTVSLDGTPSLYATTFFWETGDGYTSTLSKLSHTYLAGGTYTVCLTVSDNAGHSNKTCAEMNVDKLKPVARIRFQLDPSIPRTVKFDGTPSLYEYSYSWSFGDGSPADTNATPSHTYVAPGEYTVKLTVTGITGLTNTATTWVTVK
jgi:PKD repeat protein